MPTSKAKAKAPKAKTSKAKAGKPSKSAKSHADHLPPIDLDAPTEAVRAGAPPSEPLLAVPADKRVCIGITGEPGAGKSSLARQLGALGGTVLDVDRLGHELLEHPRIKHDLVHAFGDEILNDEGDVDRRVLADLAFANAESTALLNETIHPHLTARAKALIEKLGNFVVIDAALIHELGLADNCSITIYVKANRDNRVTRVEERGWDDAELARREQALGDADARRKKCNLAVDNTGDPNLLAAYAKTILARQIGLDLSQLKKQIPARNVEQNTAASDDDNDDNSSTDNAAETQPDRRNGQPHERRDQRHQPPTQPRPTGSPVATNDTNRPAVKLILNDYLIRKLPDLQAEADKLDVRDV
jgi:dephospho-CoA kinase